MIKTLTRIELVDLVRLVFPRFESDKVLGILVDVPNRDDEDNLDWEERRYMASDWAVKLKKDCSRCQLDDVQLIAYPSVGSNNADLPETGYRIHSGMPNLSKQLPEKGEPVSFSQCFTMTQLFLAPTEYSTTAPLKIAAKVYGFRAATMPGFSSKMIPALKIDYSEVNRLVQLLKEKLDIAESAEVIFRVDGKKDYEMFFDLRYRLAHASSGRFSESGTAGNLPSGEAYIVPYEGEKKSPSRTQGILPVQIENEILLFSVHKNRATTVTGDGEAFRSETARLSREPAYGNMAELGFGILADFGLHPIGEVLLDEKLGFHVAFGRSDHFGGIVSPKDFSSPGAVVHLDRIYIPAIQPRVMVKSLTLNFPNQNPQLLMENGNYILGC